ncbi:MAG: sigma-70 family RNA polymerase sigma factor [Kiritimatiellae bacterium]|nr:sigma-70 family RNA polymerase sigma factor [Kiritimatiellia bacterium]
MDVWQEIIKDREHGARTLVAVYKDRLFAAAMLLCRDRRAAEELVFRTFARAIDKISSFRPNTNFYNWLYTIMINFRRMDLRKEKSSAVTFTDTIPEMPTEETPFTALAAKADHAAIRAAVADLSEPLKEVILLRYFEGLPIEEIAAALVLPIGTVKSRLNYARAVLARRLAGPLGKENHNG